MSEVHVTDNSKKVLSEFEKKVELACIAIGERAVRYAKSDCPVDSGRLRNSITYATSEYKGQDAYKDNQGKTYTGGSAKGKVKDGNIFIGSNVEYARFVEFREKAKNKTIHHTTGKAHFLRDSATGHGDEYRDIAKKALM